MDRKTAQSIIVLRNVLNDGVFSNFIKYAEGDESYFPKFINKLMDSGHETNFLQYVQNLILTDINAFSKRCAAGAPISSYLESAYLNDLKVIFDCVLTGNTKGCYGNGNCSSPFSPDFNHGVTAENLKKLYSSRGFGDFINNRAFIYENDGLKPVPNPSAITLEQLKDYDYQKKLIKSNLENFINNLPYSDMLLYGDMGTGKSSAIHAFLNAYFDEGLRLIELNKENMLQISKIRQQIISNPLKFIIFIDDLSLDDQNEKISSLKASLEGSLTCGSKNTMIVATSNRRHIIKENFSDRENSIHQNDCIQEQVSLSDRFGLTVVFSSTDKAQYLSIVKQLALDCNLQYSENELYAAAERWSTVKGGRSPRHAKQLIDLLYSCQIKGESPEF